jgi:Ca2+-binding RTX toxin-like protein
MLHALPRTTEAQVTTTIIRDVQETVVIHNMFNDGESLIVTATGALINTSFGAVVGFASHQVVSVQGTIEGQVSAILMGGNQSNPIGSTVIVGAAGYVAGMGDAGVHFHPSRDSFVRNEGTIYGAVYGVWMQSSAGINRITNTGTIIGETDGIRADTGAQVLAINNDGVIHGTTHAIATYNGAAASILNTGEIIGDIYLDSGNDIYNGTNGRLTGVFYGFGGNDTALGGDDNDTLNGMTGNDTLRGNAGNDILDGASGIDRLDGGAGNDGYKLGSEASGVDALTDASGIDTVFSTITRSLAPWGFIESLTLEGTADINGTGNALANTLTGNGGKNIIKGGAGADRLVGGAGDDTYQLAADTTDTIVDTAGTDTILSTVTRSLASYPAIENLTLQGTANINGTGNDLNNTITGNVGQNTLTGGNGSDTLNGGAGMDILNGGNGDDYFILGADNDTVIDTRNQRDR